MEKVIIEEYIVFQPLKEIDESKREEMWQEITLKINNAAVRKGLKDCVYDKDNIKGLLQKAIDRFKPKLNDCSNQEVESIIGWERVLFIATQKYDEDMNKHYEKKFSPEVWNDYANKQLASISKSKDGSIRVTANQRSMV